MSRCPCPTGPTIRAASAIALSPSDAQTPATDPGPAVTRWRRPPCAVPRLGRRDHRCAGRDGGREPGRRRLAHRGVDGGERRPEFRQVSGSNQRHAGDQWLIGPVEGHQAVNGAQLIDHLTQFSDVRRLHGGPDLERIVGEDRPSAGANRERALYRPRVVRVDHRCDDGIAACERWWCRCWSRKPCR